MIPTQTLVQFPEFATGTAAKNPPGSAKYAAGFQPADVLPAEWLNYFENKSSAGITTLNSGVASIEAELNNIVSANGDTPSAETNNQVLTAIQSFINNAKAEAILAAHPVGSLYWSSKNTNPNTLFGGTWIPIKDKFIWAKGDSDTVNATGGAKTVTLEVANLPSHNHTFTGTAHNHTFTGTAVTSGTNNRGHTHSGTTSTTINPSNDTAKTLTATFKTKLYAEGTSSSREGILYDTTGIISRTRTSNTTDSNVSIAGDKTGYFTYTIDAKHRHGFTTGAESQNHTHSVTAEGTIGNTTATGTIGSTGSGTAVNKMPPYIVKYCWERTA